MLSQSALDHWYRRALPAYWIFLACATHFPGLKLPGGIPSSDKIAHTVAFALLAFLFWRFVESFRRPVAVGFVWRAGLILAAYAAVDEYTQRYVGRGVDIVDWLCGVWGMTVVLAVLEWRRVVAQRAR